MNMLDIGKELFYFTKMTTINSKLLPLICYYLNGTTNLIIKATHLNHFGLIGNVTRLYILYMRMFHHHRVLSHLAQHYFSIMLCWNVLM